MRLKPEQIEFIKNKLAPIQRNAEIYLFGSRTDDQAKGGDIDILILSEKPIKRSDIRQFKINFYKKFGWQKIDVVSFLFKQENPFKNIALDEAIKL